ncbi:hypothetical protein HELRODRAFT_172137 [Helobdella robusta]|uniref:SH3 domain-containing protein n=1 Tax=Helobdella robusta TaxID=6412 RepID=T1F522_HELRO|nr:hypothetical protein HELRODRAFT_172137 [Helobdella robusta]ESO05117.1 hypothetical protein HELRODRAFT_172137 [Helobdella robusta]
MASKFMKKRLNFYESNDSQEAKIKKEFQNFTEKNLTVTKSSKPKLADPQKIISKSLSLTSDDDEYQSDATASTPSTRTAVTTPVTLRTTTATALKKPIFKSSGQFEKYYSDLDEECQSVASFKSSTELLNVNNITSPVFQSYQQSSPHSPTFYTKTILLPKSLPTSPQTMKRVQFTSVMPIMTTDSTKISEIRQPRININGKVVSGGGNDDDDDGESFKDGGKAARNWCKQVFQAVDKLSSDIYAEYNSNEASKNSVPPKPKKVIRPSSVKLNEQIVGSSISSGDISNNNLLRVDLNDYKFNNYVDDFNVDDVINDSSSGNTESTNNINNINNNNNIDDSFWNKYRNIKTTADKFPLYALALYDFHAHYPRHDICIIELSFSRGDRLKILQKVDENWIDAELNGLKGLVPINYIQVEKVKEIVPRTTKQKCVVMYDFLAQYPSEISVKKNDIVKVIRQLRGEWLEVESGSKTEKINPSSGKTTAKEN